MTIQESVQSNLHLRSLVDHMLNGFAYCQMHFENGRPLDFTYLDVNPAFERLTGLKDVVGKRVSEVIPGILETNPELFEIYGRVASTSNPERFETYVPELDIWFSVSVYCPDLGYFVATFDNISERKLHEIQTSRIHALVLAIRRINEHLLVAENESVLFDFICNTLNDLEIFDEVWIGLKRPGSEVSPVACAGVDKEYMQTLPTQWDETTNGHGPMQMAIQEKKAIIYEDAAHDARLDWCNEIEHLHIQSGASIPLSHDGDVMGAIALWSNKSNVFDDETVKFLLEVAGDIAIGLRTLQLENKLEATLDSFKRSLEGTINAIANMVELRDPYTAGHERRVSQLAMDIGKELGLPERQIEGLRVAGFIHDIGKIAVPAEILSKPTRLSESEYAIIRNHPKAGFEILKGIDFPWPIAQTVLQHHERLDGSGYPQGLKGDDILLEARILAVADVVEAISSHRPYRPGLGIDSALEEIDVNRGMHFDPKVVDACIKLFRNHDYKLP